MRHSSKELDFWLIAGCGLGLYTFVRGFRLYREYRVLEDTPEVPIRSVAMGLVRIHGKAVGERQVLSPITHTPSFFYQVVVEKWQSSRNGGSWHHYATDADGVTFHLEDANGRVAVDAHGAEYDLIRTGRREVGGLSSGRGRLFGSRSDEEARLAASLGVGGAGTLPSDDELRAYAAAAREHRTTAALGSATTVAAIGGWATLGFGLAGGASGRFRFTESCIQPGHWYDVTGTCAENPHPTDEADHNLIVKGQNEPTFLISWRMPKDVERKVRRRAALYIFGGAVLSVACAGVLLAKEGWL